MDETMQLIEYWASYKKNHPNGSVEDFCRYQLTTTKRNKKTASNFHGLVPPQEDAYLIKLLGRIMQCYRIYATAALAEIPELKQVEDFYFLNSITQLKEVRKTEVIRLMLFDVSSGVDVINRIRDQGLIEEKVDTEDKRSRLLAPTEKGKRVLQNCYQQLSLVNDMIWRNFSHEDKLLSIQLLREVEIVHSEYAMQLKGRSFKEMLKAILGVEVLK